MGVVEKYEDCEPVVITAQKVCESGFGEAIMETIVFLAKERQTLIDENYRLHVRLRDLGSE